MYIVICICCLCVTGTAIDYMVSEIVVVAAAAAAADDDDDDDDAKIATKILITIINGISKAVWFHVR